MGLDTGNTTVNYNYFHTASLQNSSDFVFMYHVGFFIKTKA